MAALAVTNNFTAGTSIVASQMNTNFSDVVTWATGSPSLSTLGSTTTVSGALAVTEAATFSGLITANASIKLGVNDYIYWEGTAENDYETYMAATNPTADRTITLPDAGGTVALIDAASNIISNSVFN